MPRPAVALAGSPSVSRRLLEGAGAEPRALGGVIGLRRRRDFGVDRKAGGGGMATPLAELCDRELDGQPADLGVLGANARAAANQFVPQPLFLAADGANDHRQRARIGRAVDRLLQRAVELAAVVGERSGDTSRQDQHRDEGENMRDTNGRHAPSFSNRLAKPGH